MVIIYSNKITEALKYSAYVLFDEYVTITDELEVFEKSSAYKIWYCNETPSLKVDSVIIPHELLHRNNILSKGDPVFIEEKWNKNELPKNNDIFALSFYVISRLEEYYSAEQDQHGRFKSANSILKKHGLKTPWIDVWRKLLHQKIQSTHPHIKLDNAVYSHAVSLDIDHAFLFKGKEKWRVLGSIAKSTSKGNTEFLKAWKIYNSSKIDPYDSYTYLRKKLRETNIPAYFFILCGAYKKPYDTAIPFKSKAMQNLLVDLRTLGKVGLHPSYQSHNNFSILQQEYSNLQEVMPSALNNSRQHFLKFKLAQTYQNLIQIGIRTDFSMGYANELGFRAGTCRTFWWFDVEKNEKTKLKIHPISCMDGTLHEYQNLSTGQAIQEIKELKNTCKEYQGSFISLWHNHSISETFHWKGWRVVFEECLCE